jgi:hypothetical protein
MLISKCLVRSSTNQHNEKRNAVIKFYTCICLILFCCNGTTLFAQDKDVPKVTRYGFTLDQDYFLNPLGGKNEDRNYTAGLAFFLTNNRWAEKGLFRPFRWIADKTLRGCALKNFKPDLYDQIEYSATLSFGVTAFTPEYVGDNIDSIDFTINDRPFSSILFFSAKYQTASRKKVETNQFVIGMLGLGIAREVQTYGHKDGCGGSDGTIPTGWKYQVSDGGEPYLTLFKSGRYIA